MLWTIALAKRHVSAECAIRQDRRLFLAEIHVNRVLEHVVEVSFGDIAKPILRQYMEIAGIDVAIMLDDQVLLAIVVHRAERGESGYQLVKDGIEQANRYSGYVFWVPGVKNPA